jgi:hypothetical protein
MIETYIPFIRRLALPDGRIAEIDSRIYPQITLHPCTSDRAIFFNVSCKRDDDEHRTHIAEVRTTLGEHQSELAHRLLDQICREMHAGTLPPETEALLEFELLTPDEVEEWLREEVLEP